MVEPIPADIQRSKTLFTKHFLVEFLLERFMARMEIPFSWKRKKMRKLIACVVFHPCWSLQDHYSSICNYRKYYFEEGEYYICHSPLTWRMDGAFCESEKTIYLLIGGAGVRL